MEAASHTRVERAATRHCTCGNKLSNRDPHQVCFRCLGLEHARLAVYNKESCDYCAGFNMKILRRRLARLDVDNHALQEREPYIETSWGSQFDLAMTNQPMEDVLELDYGDDLEDTSEPVISEDDEDEDVFLPAIHAVLPSTLSSSQNGAASPAANLDMQSMCKRAATRLKIPWPTVVTETIRSRYEGKKLPQTMRSTKPLLPVFPELLKEVKTFWTHRPFSGKTPVQGASLLDFEDMEKAGMLRVPPMEPLVAAHLNPQRMAVSSRPPALPSKADRFQSALNKRAYKAAALSVRALNVSSMLSAYQAELCEDMAAKPDPDLWEEIALLTDICLRVQRCAVQATGKAMGMMVLQERARWLNLTNLSDTEKEDILDMPIVPDGLFGSALASMQQRCEMNKKEDHALQLCLPRKPVPPLPAPTKPFSKASTRALPKIQILKQPKPKPQRSGPRSPPQWRKKGVTVRRVINIVEKRGSNPWQAAEYEHGYDHDPHYGDPSLRSYDPRGYREDGGFSSNDYRYYDENPDHGSFHRSDSSPGNEVCSPQQYYGRDDLRHQLSSRNRSRGLYPRKRGRGSGPPPRQGPRATEDHSYRNSKSFVITRERSPSRKEAQLSTAARSRSNSRNRSFSPDRDKGYTYQNQQQHEHHEQLKEKTNVVKNQTPSSSVEDSPQSSASSKEKPFTSAVELEEVEEVEAEAAAASLEPEVTPEEDLKARRWEAINAKVLEIEKHYRQDCETFRTVVKMLITKEPSLDTLLQSSLDKNLLELRQRCLESLKSFVTELDEILEQPDHSE